MRVGIGDAIPAYEGRTNLWADQQYIVVKFRSNTDITFRFSLCSWGTDDMPYTCLDFTMDPPNYPMVGILREKLQYVGFDYPNEFNFQTGEWYYVLSSINKESEIAFAVWEENNPENLAYFRANMEEDYGYVEYTALREWRLDLYSYSFTKCPDFNIAGFFIVDFDKFQYKQ